MASNFAPSSSMVRNCYNCGQPEHLSRFCPLPDRRLVGSSNANVNTSTTIVPAQGNTVATYPTTRVSFASYGYGHGGGLKPRVETLETTVAELKAYRDAGLERERIKREEEERIKREKEEEERREREKKEREEFQSKINVNIVEQLKPVRELLETKTVKGGESDEVAKLRREIESLKMAQKNIGECSTSESIFDRYKRELEEERARADRRFVVMEEEIARLKKANEEALSSAEAWKLEALRPGNKRGSVAVTPIPEVDRLKEKLAVLEMEKKAATPIASNLKTKLDGAAAATLDKGKRPMTPKTKSTTVNKRDAFLIEQRRFLKSKKKEDILTICADEGITYTTLEKTKEKIIHKRADAAFGKVGAQRGGVVIHDIMDNTEPAKDDCTEDNGDSGAS
ncbi:hypothetical protein CBR_g26210 [Chara braunii]|uniref:CCHC-type domain-containing protein n=1 Tax=Chara braunii TaxID=69332 RepID=A0A388L7A5_CHABU|nr:hypothetical protein CBR_g26210 [Chara braunii]|eukprot:GBG78177.1 hypothetical protein CBR_g26210 [Chara braunii]